jgi:uncharacterized protein YbjT (DUF2867 family)
MKIIVFGATRGVGREAVAQALAQGHEVTAFARRPDAVAKAPGLRVVAGDASDARAVEEAVAGHDAVLTSLGSRPWIRQKICSLGTRNITRAMEARGVRRIVVVSSFGVGPSREQVPLIGRALFVRPILGPDFDDKEIMERELRASSLDWVIVQPVFLTDGARRGGVRSWTGERWDGGAFISRADVASFALEQLTSDEFLRQSPAISGPGVLGCSARRARTSSASDRDYARSIRAGSS